MSIVFNMTDNANFHAAIERSLGHSAEEIFDQWAEQQQFYWNYSGEARQLARKL